MQRLLVGIVVKGLAVFHGPRQGAEVQERLHLDRVGRQEILNFLDFARIFSGQDNQTLHGCSFPLMALEKQERSRT